MVTSRPKSEVLHVRVPKQVLDAIRKYAAADSRTVNFMARALIEQGLERRAELANRVVQR